MVLRVPWGRSWQVKISKNPNFHYMEDRGWNQFVNDNGLGENEYLTFTHEANMCFNVTIFEADGTEMLRPRKTITSSSGKCSSSMLLLSLCLRRRRRRIQSLVTSVVDFDANRSEQERREEEHLQRCEEGRRDRVLV